MEQADNIIGKLDPTKTQCGMCHRYTDTLTMSPSNVFPTKNVMLCKLCVMVSDFHASEICDPNTTKYCIDNHCNGCFKKSLKDIDFCNDVKDWIVEFEKALYE